MIDYFKKKWDKISSIPAVGHAAAQGAATVTFYVSLVSSSRVLKALRLSSAIWPISTPFAAISFVASSSLAGLSSAFAMNHFESSFPILSDDLLAQLATYSIASYLFFKLMGGRLRFILPSNVIKPGSFAKRYIPATLDYASPAERSIINRIGKKFGCHSCGVRFAFFIADHQPPVKFAAEKTITTGKAVQQRFYPHCAQCSSVQAEAVRAGRGALVSARPYRRFYIAAPLLAVWVGWEDEAKGAATRVREVLLRLRNG